jgi:tryptophanyl-tRNA synthetase
MVEESSRVLSCIQPTAEMHIGNYFGAVSNWVALQASHSCIFGVVDLHAMTMPYAAIELRSNTERMVLDLISCGLDPARTLLFVQSLVPEHTEMAWILSCLCGFGDLKRMTQFKEKSHRIRDAEEDSYISVGLFTYPVLQAADVLIYKARFVPVGKDQVQHLELSREIARRFNQQFGELFPEPQPLLTHIPKVMALADPTRKMSKSAGPKNYIGLFEDEASVRTKIRAAVTDVGGVTTQGKISPGVANLFEILKACGEEEAAAAFQAQHRAGRLKYSDLKATVADALVELTGRLRRRRHEIQACAPQLIEQVRDLSQRTRAIARETLVEVRERVGLVERRF